MLWHRGSRSHIREFDVGDITVVSLSEQTRRPRQTTARASIHLCHEDVPDDELADVATEAIEGVGDLAKMSNDEAVAEAATELFEILSKVEEVRAASEVRTDGGE